MSPPHWSKSRFHTEGWQRRLLAAAAAAAGAAAATSLKLMQAACQTAHPCLCRLQLDGRSGHSRAWPAPKPHRTALASDSAHFLSRQRRRGAVNRRPLNRQGAGSEQLQQQCSELPVALLQAAAQTKREQLNFLWATCQDLLGGLQETVVSPRTLESLLERRYAAPPLLLPPAAAAIAALRMHKPSRVRPQRLMVLCTHLLQPLTEALRAIHAVSAGRAWALAVALSMSVQQQGVDNWQVHFLAFGRTAWAWC